jgi:hypothetical protein
LRFKSLQTRGVLPLVEIDTDPPDETVAEIDVETDELPEEVTVPETVLSALVTEANIPEITKIASVIPVNTFLLIICLYKMNNKSVSSTVPIITCRTH